MNIYTLRCRPETLKILEILRDKIEEEINRGIDEETKEIRKENERLSKALRQSNIAFRNYKNKSKNL